jgi:hypothetical protein
MKMGIYDCIRGTVDEGEKSTVGKFIEKLV